MKRQRLLSLSDLVDAGLVSADDRSALQPVSDRYAIAVTRVMSDLIDASQADDPIAAQFIPTASELINQSNEHDDPIGDDAHSPVAGLVHRYPDRVLLKVASVCPVYCRFCFRREMVGPESGRAMSRADLDKALRYISGNPEIWEVVVTGGDPFMQSPRRIRDITRSLGEIDHVKVVRWHTRVPVVEPRLVTSELLSAVRAGDGLAVYVAVHANHPREFTAVARQALARLADTGICLVGQTVLLRGINDDLAVLAELMRTFVANRVKPYYLHQLDPAPGTSHFRVPLRDAQHLVRALRGHVSGLCQPTFVIDIPGGAGKVNATPCGVIDDDDKVYLVDRYGERHYYQCSDGSMSPGAETGKAEDADRGPGTDTTA